MALLGHFRNFMRFYDFMTSGRLATYKEQKKELSDLQRADFDIILQYRAINCFL